MRSVEYLIVRKIFMKHKKLFAFHKCSYCNFRRVKNKELRSPSNRPRAVPENTNNTVGTNIMISNNIIGSFFFFFEKNIIGS